MATVVNFIDTTLQAAAARTVNLPTADIQLLPSAPLFKANADGSITPESITFTATLIDLDAPLTFNATGAPLSSPTAKSVTVVGAAMTGSSVTVIASATVNGRTYTKPCTVTKVQDGVGGSTTYTWIKYADSAAGAGLSDDPTGKAYIGLAYNKSSPIESTIGSDYTWSLIKGTDGQPGPKGDDGAQLYTWIKYADYPNGDGMYELPTANTLYIGISVNKATATESNNPADYVWSRFKGDQGVPGPALYTWIKYGDSAAGAGLSDDPTNKAYIGFAYNKTTPVESENPADYTWSLNQGGQGVPGQPGKDGTTYYTWIKYADVPDGTGLYDVPTDSTVYIGIAVNKVTATESTNKADYTWSRFKGGQGVPGNPGQPGQRGTVDISAGTAGSVWSDSEATAAIAQTGYGVPQMLDVVTLYNQAAGFASTRYWNGSAWISVAQVINGSLLVKNTVAADKIDTRGLSIKDAAGNVILAAGSALASDYAATGTKNTELVPSIQAAATTAQYQNVDGRPDDALNLGLKSDFDDSSIGLWTGRWTAAVQGMPFKRAMSVSARDTEELSLIRVVPGETLYVSAYLSAGGASCNVSFGLDYKRADGSSRQIWDPCGTTIAPGTGWTAVKGKSVVPSDAAYALPWVQMDAFSNFGEAFIARPRITRFQPGATVGAPAGTNVGNRDAQTVSDYAYAGQLAYNDLPNKLAANASNILRAPITIATGGGVVVGTFMYDASSGLYGSGKGVAITPYGILTHNGSKYTFVLDTNGNAVFAGSLDAAYGTFGALRIAPGGFIASGNFDGSWAWPSAGAGFLIHANGLLFGNRNDASSGFFSIGSNGVIEAPGLSYSGRQLRLDSPVIINPVLSPFSLGITNSQNQYNYTLYRLSTDAYAGLYIATIDTGNDGASFNWTVSGPWPCWLVQDSATNRMQLHINMKGGAALAGDAGDFYVNCAATKGGNTVNTQRLITVTAS